MSQALAATPSTAVQLPHHDARPSNRQGQLLVTNIFRSGHLNLDTVSPVNENGSFEFDRVLKRGIVSCRTRSRHVFKPSWKPAYLVLRPNLLSVYKDEEEASLWVSITLSDTTAVVAVKPPRYKREHVFGIFSPEKNYKFQAPSEADSNDWIKHIRAEVHIDEEDEALLLQSQKSHGGDISDKPANFANDLDRDGRSSSSEASPTPFPEQQSSKHLPNPQGYSGNEITEYSDLSDALMNNAPQHSVTSLSGTEGKPLAPSGPKRNQLPVSDDVSQPRDCGVIGDPERVICQGYLQCLRSKRGVRQWRKMWVVLRPNSFGLYKNEKEHSAVKIIPMSQVINAAEIDPVSRSKTFCLQIIDVERSYRFCAPCEEVLEKWLGALKSVIVARKRAVDKAETEV